MSEPLRRGAIVDLDLDLDPALSWLHALHGCIRRRLLPSSPG
jgi:hypothetical protein